MQTKNKSVQIISAKTVLEKGLVEALNESRSSVWTQDTREYKPGELVVSDTGLVLVAAHDDGISVYAYELGHKNSL